MGCSNRTTVESRVEKLESIETELRKVVRKLNGPNLATLPEAQLLLDVQRARRRYENLLEDLRRTAGSHAELFAAERAAA
jgi:hypothetical protein